MPPVSRWDFFRRFLADGRAVGAVTPSSGAVARAMCDQVDLARARAVVELGPGTGAITREILRRLPTNARLYAFEIDPTFVAHLRETIDDPRLVVVAESAERLIEVLRARDAFPADHVFSEIPYANLPADLRRRILEAARGGVRDGGSLVVLQYLPFATMPHLRELFADATIGAYVPMNLPPAFILRADTELAASRARAEPTPLRLSAPLSIGAVGLGALLAWAHPLLGLAAVATLGGVLYFHRDPRRRPPIAAGVALAPADGRVIAVERVRDPHWGEEMHEVRIFLSMLDVHIQRSPLPGRVVRVESTPGARLPAMRLDAGHRNERNAIYLEGDAGRCVVVQVAGALARTIVCWVNPGQEVGAGEKLGMIRLGSQTAARLPLEYEVAVRVGDSVKAGLDVLARIPPPR